MAKGGSEYLLFPFSISSTLTTPGADPRFDEGGGSDKRPLNAVAPRGGPGAWSPEKCLILGPLKCDFQRFQEQFEVV